MGPILMPMVSSILVSTFLWSYSLPSLTQYVVCPKQRESAAGSESHM